MKLNTLLTHFSPQISIIIRESIELGSNVFWRGNQWELKNNAYDYLEKKVSDWYLNVDVLEVVLK